jgi:predicted TPR repeat methyltransferase
LATNGPDELVTPSGERRVEDAPIRPALARAMKLHQAGDLRKAEAAYRSVLRAMPRDPVARHFLGVACFQQGRCDEGLEHVHRALKLAPSYVDAWSNLGNLYKESGRTDDADAAYRKALAVDEGHAEAWNNLGIVLRATGRAGEAVAALRRGVACSPGFANAYFNLGNALRDCGNASASVEAYRNACLFDPAHSQAHRRLGQMLYAIGAHAEAAEVFRQWLAADPDHPVASHMLSACTGEDVPDRASDAYVVATFDAFASSFDEVLLHRLEYRAPRLVLEALERAVGDGGEPLDIVDAGCGTGLCGPLLASRARLLTGVDLSDKMLAKAEVRKVYHRLVKGEITQFLGDHPAAFDVIVSADTLCYFGDLAGVTAASRGALRPGGVLVFTVERADDVLRYRIESHGRYSHARDYVRAVLEHAGFDDIVVEPAVLRKERGAEVAGWVVSARMPDEL